MGRFRFQDLKIWKKAMEIADKLFDIADRLEEKKLYRFANQLRGSGLSMSNNIAEGSGSHSTKVFARYLDIAHSSVFENANVVIMLKRRNLIDKAEYDELLDELEHEARMITSFKKSL